MRLAVKRLGPELDYLPDGETGVRRNWVIGMIEGFRTHPDLRLVKDGDWSDYDKTPRFALQPGHRLYGAALNLGIAAAARAAMSEFDTLRAELADGEHPGPRFLVGIPGDVDLALFTFGPSGPVRHLRPFTEALAATMHQVRALFGVRFVAGFAHEDQDEVTQFRIRELIEGAVGRPVDVSTSCGLGRRQPGAALAAMDRIKLLLD